REDRADVDVVRAHRGGGGVHDLALRDVPDRDDELDRIRGRGERFDRSRGIHRTYLPLVRSECTITGSKHEATSLGTRAALPLRGKLVRCARVRGGARLQGPSLGSWPAARGRAAEESASGVLNRVPQRSPAATSGRDQGRAARGEPATTGR